MDKKLNVLVRDIRSLFRDARIFLFGSRANGNAKPGSDYDLIIVSEGFKPITFVNRPGMIWRKTLVGIAADLLCYTPKEFEKASKTSYVLKDALKHALPL